MSFNIFYKGSKDQLASSDLFAGMDCSQGSHAGCQLTAKQNGDKTYVSIVLANETLDDPREGLRQLAKNLRQKPIAGYLHDVDGNPLTKDDQTWFDGSDNYSAPVDEVFKVFGNKDNPESYVMLPSEHYDRWLKLTEEAMKYRTVGEQATHVLDLVKKTPWPTVAKPVAEAKVTPKIDAQVISAVNKELKENIGEAVKAIDNLLAVIELPEPIVPTGLTDAAAVAAESKSDSGLSEALVSEEPNQSVAPLSVSQPTPPNVTNESQVSQIKSADNSDNSLIIVLGLIVLVLNELRHTLAFNRLKSLVKKQGEELNADMASREGAINQVNEAAVRTEGEAARVDRKVAEFVEILDGLILQFKEEVKTQLDKVNATHTRITEDNGDIRQELVDFNLEQIELLRNRKNEVLDLMQKALTIVKEGGDKLAEDFSKKLKGFSDDINHLDQELDRRMNEAVQKVTDSVKAQVSKQITAQFDDLKSQLDRQVKTYEDLVNQARADLGELTQQSSVLRSEIVAMPKDVEAAQSRLSTLSELIAQAETRLADLNAQKDVVAEAASQAKLAQDDLKAAQSELLQVVGRHQDSIDAGREGLQATQAEVLGLVREKIESLKAVVDGFTTYLDGVADQEPKIADLRAKLANADATAEAYKAALESARSELEMAKGAAEGVRSELADAGQTLADLETKARASISPVEEIRPEDIMPIDGLPPVPVAATLDRAVPPPFSAGEVMNVDEVPADISAPVEKVAPPPIPTAAQRDTAVYYEDLLRAPVSTRDVDRIKMFYGEELIQNNDINGIFMNANGEDYSPKALAQKAVEVLGVQNKLGAEALLAILSDRAVGFSQPADQSIVLIEIIKSKDTFKQGINPNSTTEAITRTLKNKMNQASAATNQYNFLNDKRRDFNQFVGAQRLASNKMRQAIQAVPSDHASLLAKMGVDYPGSAEEALQALKSAFEPAVRLASEHAAVGKGTYWAAEFYDLTCKLEGELKVQRELQPELKLPVAAAVLEAVDVYLKERSNSSPSLFGGTKVGRLSSAILKKYKDLPENLSELGRSIQDIKSAVVSKGNYPRLLVLLDDIQRSLGTVDEADREAYVLQIADEMLKDKNKMATQTRYDAALTRHTEAALVHYSERLKERTTKHVAGHHDRREEDRSREVVRKH